MKEMSVFWNILIDIFLMTKSQETQETEEQLM